MGNELAAREAERLQHAATCQRLGSVQKTAIKNTFIERLEDVSKSDDHTEKIHSWPCDTYTQHYSDSEEDRKEDEPRGAARLDALEEFQLRDATRFTGSVQKTEIKNTFIELVEEVSTADSN